MNKIIKLKKELMILKTLEIKPNYSELARTHNCDRRTVKKYNDGYEGKQKNRINHYAKYKTLIINELGFSKITPI